MDLNLVNVTESNDLKLLLLQIGLQKDDPVDLYEKYESTVHRLDKIYADAPKTTNKAVEMAIDNLKMLLIVVLSF